MNITGISPHEATEQTVTLSLRVSTENPTADARAIWAVMFPLSPWPDGVTVRWARYGRPVIPFKEQYPATSSARYKRIAFVTRRELGCYKVFSRGIILNLQYLEHDPPRALDTLVHELVHAAGFDRHNLDFYRVQNEALARLGRPPRWRPQRLDRFGEPYPRRKKQHRRCAETLPLWPEAHRP